MIYIFIIVLLAAQIWVVIKTKKLTVNQRNIFEDNADKYEVEDFFIPKNEISTITYDDIQKDIEIYNKEGDTYKTVERVEYNPNIDNFVTIKTQDIYCRKRDKIKVNLIQINPSNEVSSEIQRVTNNYLLRNKGAASDYSLIKDIVERNCNSIEEEIQTQTPWPLYFGLMGTMAGIILGIGSIGLTVGFSEFVQHPEMHIGDLMGDVAMAMIVSFVGIGCTTYLSYLAKDAKTALETKKNSFYSWFQAELMPIITKENASAGLKRLEENLSKFNESFEHNVKELNSTFSLVKSTSHDQATLLSSLQHMDLANMATANVQILSKFNETVGKLEGFNKYIDYAQSALNDIQQRNNAITEATIAVDNNLDKVFAELKEGVAKQVSALEESLAQSGNAMEALLANEEKMLKQQGTRIDTFFNTLQDLKPVINGLNDWKKELQRQTTEIGRLASSINNMPVSDGKGNVIVPKQSPINKYFMIGGFVLAFILVIILTVNMFYTISLSNTMNVSQQNQYQHTQYQEDIVSDTMPQSKLDIINSHEK